jgi:integrase
MSTGENMARLPGLFQRKGVWYLRVMIPLPLRDTAYAGRSQLVETLRTSDSMTSKVKGTVRRAELLAEFEMKAKELNPQRVELVTPEMGKLLAERITAKVLGMDEKLRSEPAAARMLLDASRVPTKLRIGPYEPAAPFREAKPLDPLEGMPLELLLELGDVNDAINQEAASLMASQRLAAVLPLVQAEARSLGLQFDEKVPGAMDALRACLKAYRKAWQDVAARDDGEVVDTPAAPTLVAMKQAKPAKLRDVLPQWKASKKRREQTEKAAELALALYEKSTGNPPISSLTRAQGVDCRAFLLAQNVSSKTARDRFDYIKGFLNFASRELELLPKNPWEGLAIEHTTTTPRRPWSGEQLAALFSKPLFTRYELSQDWHAGGDAAYWIPIMGIYTGARVGELCQLAMADIETVDGVPVIRITDQGEEQSVKTEAGRRVVPVHPELIRLGFLDYVSALRETGAKRLFPALLLAPSKPSNYFSAWFKTVRDEDDSVALPDFHSFRHTVRSKRNSPTSTVIAPGFVGRQHLI